MRADDVRRCAAAAPGIVAVAILVAGCTTAPPAGLHDDELGGSASPVESVSFTEAEAPVVTGGCASEFAADDVAGFVQEWFGAVAGLQLTCDANAVRQFVGDPEGRKFEERRSTQLCIARRIAVFAQSPDVRIRDLARAMDALLADAADAEARAGEVFRRTDWNAYGTADERACHWSRVRPSTHSLSQRGAALTERIVALLREDGRMDYGPGTLRITREGRDIALRHRGRLTDLTIMVELGVDAGEPLSMTARKVIKWLYHAHGLDFAASSP